MTGLAAVLARLPEVYALVYETAQQAECIDLPYLLSRPARLQARPVLVLLHHDPDAGQCRQTRLCGAVVLYEFGSFLRGQKIFSCYSRRGFRTVLGPAQQRVALAARAVQALLERGALFVNLEIDMGPIPSHPAVRKLLYEQAAGIVKRHVSGLAAVRTEWAIHDGLKPFDLALYPVPERTWSAVSNKTWKNFRRNQRLCIRELGCRYEAAATVDRETFLELSRHSSYAVSGSVAAWRFDSLGSFPNVFLAGLRDRDGLWLALIGGRRDERMVTIDWQMNRTGYERYSLGTTARSFLIGHEAAQGLVSLCFEGGTNGHSIFHSFRPHTVYNLAVRRHSLRLLWLERFLLRFFPRKFLTLALVKPWRQWIAAGPAAQPRGEG